MPIKFKKAGKWVDDNASVTLAVAAVVTILVLAIVWVLIRR